MRKTLLASVMMLTLAAFAAVMASLASAQENPVCDQLVQRQYDSNPDNDCDSSGTIVVPTDPVDPPDPPDPPDPGDPDDGISGDGDVSVIINGEILNIPHYQIISVLDGGQSVEVPVAAVSSVVADQPPADQPVAEPASILPDTGGSVGMLFGLALVGVGAVVMIFRSKVGTIR